MKRDLAIFAAGALSGGTLVLARARLIGAAKVLFGRAEAVALAEAPKIKAAAEAEVKKIEGADKTQA
jgi:hypothetical protein